MELVIAADVGKRFDSSALAVVQLIRPSMDPIHTDTSKWVADWKVPIGETYFHVRELGRMKIGTAYTDQAYELAKVAHDARCADPEGSLRFLLDATGVGEGVADLLEKYMPSSVRLTRCWFTSSERMERVKGELRIGKPWMISRLTNLLESGRVKLGDIPQRLDLVEELQAFEYRITAGGHYTADARPGMHDDLITALGLATLTDGAAVGPVWRGLPFGESPRLDPTTTDDWTVLHSHDW